MLTARSARSQMTEIQSEFHFLGISFFIGVEFTIQIINVWLYIAYIIYNIMPIIMAASAPLDQTRAARARSAPPRSFAGEQIYSSSARGARLIKCQISLPFRTKINAEGRGPSKAYGQINVDNIDNY